jgi:hypothetical protein
MLCFIVQLIFLRSVFAHHARTTSYNRSFNLHCNQIRHDIIIGLLIFLKHSKYHLQQQAEVLKTHTK